MGERQHTIVGIFDPTSLHIWAYELHEWIHDTLQVPDHSLTMIQIDGTKKQFVGDTYTTYYGLRTDTLSFNM
jgi:hypothetical protein